MQPVSTNESGSLQNPETEIISLKLRWFSVLAEKRGRREEFHKAEKGITVEKLMDELEKEFDAFTLYRPHIRTGVNNAYAGPDMVLSDGDEIAFITPVSGG